MKSGGKRFEMHMLNLSTSAYGLWRNLQNGRASTHLVSLGTPTLRSYKHMVRMLGA